MSCVIRFDTISREIALARRMADVKSEISRILHVKCRAFLTPKDDFLVSAYNGPKLHRWFKRPAAAYKLSAGHCPLVIMCTFTVFRLGRTAPHFRPNEGAGGGKAGHSRDLNKIAFGGYTLLFGGQQRV